MILFDSRACSRAQHSRPSSSARSQKTRSMRESLTPTLQVEAHEDSPLALLKARAMSAEGKPVGNPSTRHAIAAAAVGRRSARAPASRTAVELAAIHVRHDRRSLGSRRDREVAAHPLDGPLTAERPFIASALRRLEVELDVMREDAELPVRGRAAVRPSLDTPVTCSRASFCS